jgi:hypothetical protein
MAKVQKSQEDLTEMSEPSAQNQNSTNQPHIFLDLDGVLADFDLHAHQENKIGPDGKLKYDELDYKWWSTMPAFEGAREFYDAARKLGIVKFLTGPMMSEECFSGKAHWVQEFVPERGKFILKDLIICPSSDKAYLARANHILVDDREENVRAWEAAGGVGIHHTGNLDDTMKKLQDAVAKLSAPPLAVKKPNSGGISPKIP